MGLWIIPLTSVCYLYLQKEGDKFLETAQKHGIPLSALPVHLGGEHAGRPLNCSFKPSVADTPLPAPKTKEAAVAEADNVVCAPVEISVPTLTTAEVMITTS